MSRKQKVLRLVSVLLALCLLLSIPLVAGAASESYDLQLNSTAANASGLANAGSQTKVLDTPEADELLRVIIIFKDRALVEKGYSTAGLAENDDALAYSSKLIGKQETAMQAVERVVGTELPVHYRFTIGVNGVATTVRYDQIPAIEKLSNVRAVYIENRYQPDVIAEPDTGTSGDMTGSYRAWANGYTGAGSRIAIIDTGLDTDHPSFDASCFRYGLELSAAKFGKTVSDYKLLTIAEIAAVLPRLHVAELLKDVTAEDLYINEKIPFGFNYVDENLNVTHDNDSQSDHGTHVAGIATANTYVWGKDADGDVVAMRQANGVVGVAPDAQILPMKVFGASGGAYDSDYMAALEDAILLGCDTANLSLGSANPGHTYGNYEELFASLVDSDIVVTISAGNKYSYAQFNTTGTYLNLTTDTVIDTVGSPGAFRNSLAVASINNYGLTGVMPSFNGVVVPYSDTGEQYKINVFTTLDTSLEGTGTDYPYVFLGDPTTGENIYGAEEDFTGIDVTGKIVIISRGGGVSFFQKANNAAAAGAAAIVVYNNVEGSINMNLTGYTYKNPAVTIELSYAKEILDRSEKNDDGLYSGTMTMSNEIRTVLNVSGGYEPSNFSSWGVPGNLDLKPEIAAPGGNIWSTLTDGTYGTMSGTSMAAPNANGMAAVVAQYIRENKLNQLQGMTVRSLSQALLMSTSLVLREDLGNGESIAYSPRKQGSGLGYVYNAVTTPAFLLTDNRLTTDGKVKVTLGDDPDREGKYEFSFTINSLTQKTLAYRLRAEINSMAVETVNGEDYMSDTAYALSPLVSFETSAAYSFVYDLNGDGKLDKQDASVILAIANGKSASESEQLLCDLDKDGVVTSYDARLFLECLEGKNDAINVFDTAYTVPAGSSIEIKVTVTLSDVDREYLAENYPNGCYVEGFIYADDPTAANPELSFPMLAYYGNWTEPSMFDKYITLRDYYNTEAMSYTGVRPENYVVIRTGGSGLLVTPNPYGTVAGLIEDRTAINSVNGDYINGAVATLIRNAGGATMTVISNAETGEIYYTKQFAAQYSAYYSTTSGAWANYQTQFVNNWVPLDSNGNPLPEGTKIKYSIVAIPEYNWDRTEGELVGELADGAYWNTIFTVDNTAPEITAATLHRNLVTGKATLNISAQDDRYLAAVLVTNLRQNKVLTRASVDQTTPGIGTDLEIDVTDIQSSSVCLLAVDYAGNISAYTIEIGSGEKEDVTQRIYANNAYTDKWISFIPEDMGNSVDECDGAIDAAEYVDGYVFSVDKEKKFYVAPFENLEERTFIETLDLPSRVLDMAYSYRDKKMYALTTNNRIYSIDLFLGTVELIGTIPMSNGQTLQTLAISTDGTFYGVNNHANNSRLYTITFDEEYGFEVTPAPNLTGMPCQYLQSMTYDHNTGKLYHANYGYAASTLTTTLVTYDLKTGLPTIVSSMDRCELTGMFIPAKSSPSFGGSEEVISIGLSEEKVEMFLGATKTLEVSTKPWTVSNRRCDWVSSDPTVATVENGVVTAVGAGTCTITATSVVNPEATASCEVKVTAVSATLTASIWDADGKSWFSEFRTDNLPNFTKLAAAASSETIISVATAADGTTYAASYETKDGALISSLYTVGADYSLTKIGTSNAGYTDMTWAPSVAGQGRLVATYGTYLFTVNTTTGGVEGSWNLNSKLGADTYVVGVCYASTTNDPNYGKLDVLYLLDSKGNIWKSSVGSTSDGLVLIIPVKIASIGVNTNGRFYLSSMATDGNYLYCSVCDGEKTEIVLYALASGASVNLGGFDAEIWPAVGLQVKVPAATSDATAAEIDSGILTGAIPAETDVVLPGFVVEK